MTTSNFRKKELLSLFEIHLTRVEMLAGEEKAIVKLFLSSGKYTTIAKVVPLSEAAVVRRLQKIARRIDSDNFIAGLSQNTSLKDEETKVLKDHFINGITITAIVKNTGLSRYAVEKIIKKHLKN